MAILRGCLRTRGCPGHTIPLAATNWFMASVKSVKSIMTVPNQLIMNIVLYLFIYKLRSSWGLADGIKEFLPACDSSSQSSHTA